jgi:hypothetical protein
MPRTAVVTAAQRALLALIVVTVSLFSLTTRGYYLATGRGHMMALMAWGLLRDWQAPALPFPAEPAA